jgi:threonine dehydratase
MKIKKQKIIYERIKPLIKKTELIFAEKISKEVNANIYLKLENLQYNGSFKIRGAANKLLKMLEEKKITKNTNIFAASAGNHAQGVAMTCQKLKLKNTIVMPLNTPIQKIEATKGLGANVVLFGNDVDESLIRAKKLCIEAGGIFIHPFDDQDIIDGQGTIGYEVLNQLPNVDVIVVPIGGGGLISGIGQSIKGIKPDTKIIGIESEATNSFSQSISQNKIIKMKTFHTIADGIAVKQPGVINFKIAKKYVDEYYSVSEGEIASSIVYLLEKCKIIVEGAGAVGVAHVLSSDFKFQNKNVVVIISGGNIDLNIIEEIIKRGLTAQGRRMSIKVVIKNTPGELNKMFGIIAKHGGNVLNISQDRNSSTTKIREIIFRGLIETRGFKNRKDIIDDLEKNNYHVKVN